MLPQQEIELTDPKLNPALKYGKSLAEKRFMLNLFIKYNIQWHNQSLLQRFGNYLISFWPSSTPHINDLTEKEIDIQLSQLEPQIPTESCIVNEITLDEFTLPENISGADERILGRVKYITETDNHLLTQYANNGNPVAQLLISFILASKYDSSVTGLTIISSEGQLAKKYLEQSATQYDLAKFFLSRNKLFGNDRWCIIQDIRSSINDIKSLSKPSSIYTILSTSLLYNAYKIGIIKTVNLDNRLNALLKLIMNDQKRIDLDLAAMNCRGAQPSPPSKLSHIIINRNSQFEGDDEANVLGECKISFVP